MSWLGTVLPSVWSLRSPAVGRNNPDGRVARLRAPVTRSGSRSENSGYNGSPVAGVANLRGEEGRKGSLTEQRPLLSQPLMGLRGLLHVFFAGIFLAILSGQADAQGNFEIQVYGSETVAPGTTKPLRRGRPICGAAPQGYRYPCDPALAG